MYFVCENKKWKKKRHSHTRTRRYRQAGRQADDEENKNAEYKESLDVYKSGKSGCGKKYKANERTNKLKKKN